tara:strand:+ start:226 stop:621 length:396 start_codon:yes stop_codon:yes gene_type:complete
MKGIYINTVMSGLAYIQASKKDGEQPCIVRNFKNGGSVAQMRVSSGGWYFSVKFDPSLIDGDALAMVAGEQIYFEGHLAVDKYTKKGETKISYFNYVRITRIVYGEGLSSQKDMLQKKAVESKIAELQAML